jgi:hypothetical protein
MIISQFKNNQRYSLRKVPFVVCLIHVMFPSKLSFSREDKA